MEHSDSILQTATIDSSGQNQLKSAGKWSKFIGIVYEVIAALLLIITVLLFANLDQLAASLMDINGLSQEALGFLMGAGKWLFMLGMILSCFILTLNGYLLIKFGKSVSTYLLLYNEENLNGVFSNLGKYFMLTCILSVFSILFSIVAVIYYILI